MGTLSSAIGRRFHCPPAPSAIVCLDSKDPIVFSHVTGTVAMPAPTLAVPAEDVFCVHVHHATLRRGDLWIESRHRAMPFVPVGGLFIFDLRTRPTAQVHEPFEFSRFQISRATLNDLAYEHGMRCVGELRAPTCQADPVVRHLALAMLQRAGSFGEGSLFADAIALALFAHLAHKYAGAVGAANVDGMFAPWQIRRITDWVNANMNGPVTLADLAALVNLSRSHFARVFMRSLGMSPHRWLLLRRVERAKDLLKAALPLAEIAAACGFVDQSHFNRVFTRIEGVTPGAWRRNIT
jgi:AraC-like DNA-binding protein